MVYVSYIGMIKEEIMEKRLVIAILGFGWKVKAGISQNQDYVLGGPTKRRIVFRVYIDVPYLWKLRVPGSIFRKDGPWHPLRLGR